MNSLDEKVMDEPVVTYTVKEMLTRIDAKLDAYNSSQSSRMDQFDARLAVLETERHSSRALSDRARYIIATILTAVAAMSAAFAVIHK